MVLTSDETIHYFISTHLFLPTMRRIGNLATTSTQAEKKKMMLAFPTQPYVLPLR